MAIMFKGIKLKLDSYAINGIMGDYELFFHRLAGNNISYYKMDEEEPNSLVNLFPKDKLLSILKELSLEDEFITKDYQDLSSGEKSLFKIIKMILSDKKIMIMDEPFLYLDAFYQKKVIVVLRRIVYRNRKTIIIGSSDSNLIYQICKKVAFIKDNDYVFDTKEKMFTSKEYLAKYNIIEPEIIRFYHLASEKGINLEMDDDIRDLIKEVYRHVPKE